MTRERETMKSAGDITRLEDSAATLASAFAQRAVLSLSSFLVLFRQDEAALVGIE
jgi:hypothetical protein